MKVQQENLRQWLLDTIDERTHQHVTQMMEGLCLKVAKVVEVMANRYEGEAKNAVLEVAGTLRTYSMTLIPDNPTYVKPDLTKLIISRNVYAMYRQGAPHQAIAAKYGLTLAQVSQLIANQHRREHAKPPETPGG